MQSGQISQKGTLFSWLHIYIYIYIYIVPSDKWRYNGNGADVNKGTKILKIWALYQK